MAGGEVKEGREVKRTNKRGEKAKKGTRGAIQRTRHKGHTFSLGTPSFYLYLRVSGVLPLPVHVPLSVTARMTLERASGRVQSRYYTFRFPSHVMSLSINCLVSSRLSLRVDNILLEFPPKGCWPLIVVILFV